MLRFFQILGQPMFFTKEKVLLLKCFTNIEQSDDYTKKIVSDKLVKEDTLSTENMDIEELLEFCVNVAGKSNKNVVLELWTKNKDVDIRTLRAV